MIYQEKIFTKEECQTIIDYHMVYNQPISNIYPQRVLDGDNKVKNPEGGYEYHTYFILKDDRTEWFFNRIINWFSKNADLELNEELKYCTLHNYKTGHFFKKHIDVNTTYKSRRWNLGIQLNDTYEGGEYVLWDTNNVENHISKEVGTSLFYHCRVPHEIKEITNGERWSIVMPVYSENIIEKNKSLL